MVIIHSGMALKGDRSWLVRPYEEAEPLDVPGSMPDPASNMSMCVPV